jgi:hypothetical protein
MSDILKLILLYTTFQLIKNIFDSKIFLKKAGFWNSVSAISPKRKQIFVYYFCTIRHIS